MSTFITPIGRTLCSDVNHLAMSHARSLKRVLRQPVIPFHLLGIMTEVVNAYLSGVS